MGKPCVIGGFSEGLAASAFVRKRLTAGEPCTGFDDQVRPQGIGYPIRYSHTRLYQPGLLLIMIVGTWPPHVLRSVIRRHDDRDRQCGIGRMWNISPICQKRGINIRGCVITTTAGKEAVGRHFASIWPPERRSAIRDCIRFARQ